MIKKTVALLMSVIILLMCGCAGKNGGEKVKDKNKESGNDGITIFSYKPDTFCPILSNNEANLRMLGIIYEGLISLNDELMPEACLAESWTVSQNGTQWNFKLKKGVKWHSGGELTADDVVYTVEQIKKAGAGAYVYNVSNIEKIEAKGSGEVQFTLGKPSANFANLMYFPIIKKGDGDVDTAVFKADGTGPYCFEDRNEGNIYYLVRNSEWWGGTPSAETVKVRMLPGGDTALYAFSSGSVDLAPVGDMDWGKFVDPMVASYTSIPTPVFNFLGVNHNDGALGFSELRQAISYAIDRDEMVEKAMMGYAESANTPIRKKWFMYGDQNFVHKQNFDDAKKLLEENGWRLERNIYKKTVDNVQYFAEFDILINEKNTVRENIAGIIANNLEKFGIRANIVRVPYETYTERIAKGEYDTFVGSMALSADLDFMPLFGSGNMFGFEDEEFFFVLEDMQTRQNAEDTKAVYAEFINLFEQLNPVIGLFFEDSVMLYSKQIEEKTIKPSYFDIYRGIEKMHKGE